MASNRSDPGITPASMLWACEALSRRLRIPLDTRAIAAELAALPGSLDGVLVALRSIGLDGEILPSYPDDPARCPRFSVALARPSSRKTGTGDAHAGESASDAARDGGPPGRDSILVVIERDEAGFVLHRPDEHAPRALSRAEVGALVAGPVLFAGPAHGERADQADVPPADPAFGLHWVARETFRHTHVWRDVLLASAAIQAVALLVPLLTQVVIDKVIVHRTASTLVVVAVALALVTAFTALMTWVRQYLVIHAGQHIDAVLGGAVFDHLLRLPPRYFENRPTGTLVARLQGVETIRDFLAGAGVALLLDIPFLLLFLGLMIHYSPTLSIVVLAMVCAIVLLSLAVTPMLRARVDRQFLAGARNQAFVTEFVSAIETVKSQQMEPQLRSHFGQLLSDYLDAGRRTRVLASSYGVVANALEQTMTVAVLCLGAWLVMTEGHLTVGMLVAFQMFAGRVAGPILRIAGLWQEFQRVEIAARRLGDILGAPPEPYSNRLARAVTGRASLRMQGVGFRYSSGAPFLFRGLDVALEPGACIALTGPSGCGKSTLARLLQGFHPPTEGQILIDDVDVGHMAANELRRDLGVVLQETRLFSGTIYWNLVLGVPHASLDDVVESCRLADIHATISRLPQGYQTRIGEHGVGLSGGQKQRLAIARALLRRPRLLIFDEATSNLDAQSASAVAATINRLRGHVSVLFIAHQLPPGLLVDRVLALAEPKIEQEAA